MSIERVPSCVRRLPRMSAKCITSAAALLSLLVCAQAAQAGGLYLNEFATPSMGVAGAGQEAVTSDASTAFAFHNPAGMTRLDGNQVSVGAGVGYGETKFDPDPNTPFSGGNGGNQAGLFPLLGSHGVLGVTDDLKFGMSVFSISGAVIDPDNDWTGRYQLREIELLTLSFNPSVAYRLNDRLSVAAGFIATYADIDYQIAAPIGGPGNVEIGGDDWAFGFNLGALFELSPRTRVGIIYVSEIEPEFSGDLEITTGGGASFSAPSTLKFTYPQLVRVGAYHELNDQWALLGSVGWEDWSAFDSFTVATTVGAGSIPTGWEDTYHFSGGVHYRLNDDWLLQTGITYDTSPVSSSDRTADLPVDRQIRVAVGAQYQLSERMNVGGAFEYIDLGDAKINNPISLIGNYQDNRIFMLAFNLGYKF